MRDHRSMSRSVWTAPFLLCCVLVTPGVAADAAPARRRRGGKKLLKAANLNPLLVEAEYAVRGAIPDRAEELRRQIAANPTGHGLPFDRIIPCNIGNPQALGQKPLSFNRQVLSLVTNTELLQAVEASPDQTLAGTFKVDAVQRARKYTDRMTVGGMTVGAYSNSQGVEVVREEVASFIEARDGIPGSSSPDNIFLTDGASAGVRMLYQAMLRPGQADGVLVPIPQYPLYSALSTLFDGKLVGYVLDEEKQWKVTVAELRRALRKAKADGVNTRALVVINPGNPTGQCLDVETMKDIVQFCVDEELILMADEVYQENIYVEGRKFTSFKKVVLEMGENARALELISFHSISKGFLGECGIRGGYFELHNIESAVKAALYKLASITLCPNTHGQISVGLMVNPPSAGSESYSLYIAERDAILDSLKRRSLKIAGALNALEGISCRTAEGAMYVFPQVQLPPAAVTAADAASLPPDTFYCMRMLEATGIATVPGTGFKQKNGTFHFRTTFLPPEDAMDEVVERLSKFHKDFMREYAKQEL
eukprot:gnl/TRDRNA2_/TRDRNA2_168957_c1_seq1.p1 gnl/TRDRNA2_/TRDRNA2_168957_c1~~gnl/TRDRNA2_/TRDRNA2_168957_c1_seq1.p1  ORF type:complete len:538 (+),score=101.63 gnl/TRDRNA2_/TRDRNA2_168957_c1_seq1:1-1614(+)